MNLDHLLHLVDEHVALNATFEGRGPRKYPAQTRFLLDMAREGTCGQPAKVRQRKAPWAQELGDFLPDRAASEPLLDLAYVLRTATDDLESHELCARGVGAAWRAEHPFRKGRPGDPLDVLLPHVSDEMAVLALDRAKVLQPLPSTPLMRHAVELEDFLSGRATPDFLPTEPYNPSLAAALVSSAIEAVAGLPATSSQVITRRATRVLTYLRRLRAWTQLLSYDLSLDTDEDEPGTFAHVTKTQVESLEKEIISYLNFNPQATTDTFTNEMTAAQAYETAGKMASAASGYILGYNRQLKYLGEAKKSIERSKDELANAREGESVWGSLPQLVLDNGLAKVKKLRALFPDLYPEEP